MDGQTDRWTDRWTDGQTDRVSVIYGTTATAFIAHLKYYTQLKQLTFWFTAK